MERLKVDKNLQFKTIDDPILIDQLIADRNAKYLNQVDGTSLTVEPLLSLVGKDTFTIFPQEVLDGTVDLSQLKLSPTKNSTIVNSLTNTKIPYKEYLEGFKNWKEKTMTLHSGSHLGHHTSLLRSDRT